MTPEQAEVKQSDGTWAQVMAHGLALEATVRIRPGERVPLDGVVIAGSSATNQAPVTGESIRPTRLPATPCSPARSAGRPHLSFG